MSSINYIDEFNLFMRYARNYQLSGRERLLWIALFTIANDRAIYNAQAREYEWPTDFFPVPNGELSLHSTLDKRGIESVRNSLKQRGLIDFHPGSRNARPAEYKINYLSVNVGYKTVPNDAPSNVPKNAPNIIPNSVPNSVPSNVTSNVPSNAPLLIDIDYIQSRDNLFISYDGDDKSREGTESAISEYLQWSGITVEDYFVTNPALKEALCRATLRLFDSFGGRQATKTDAAYVLSMTRSYQGGMWVLDTDRLQLLTYCFEQASRKGCPGNWKYIGGCMRNLDQRGIKTIADIEDYEFGEWGSAERSGEG